MGNKEGIHRGRPFMKKACCKYLASCNESLQSTAILTIFCAWLWTTCKCRAACCPSSVVRRNRGNGRLFRLRLATLCLVGFWEGAYVDWLFAGQWPIRKWHCSKARTLCKSDTATTHTAKSPRCMLWNILVFRKCLA